MITERMNHYIPYFKSIKESETALAFSMSNIDSNIN